jgi:hypothetical protein
VQCLLLQAISWRPCFPTCCCLAKHTSWKTPCCQARPGQFSSLLSHQARPFLQSLQQLCAEEEAPSYKPSLQPQTTEHHHNAQQPECRSHRCGNGFTAPRGLPHQTSWKAGGYLLAERSRQAGSYLLTESSRRARSCLFTKSSRRAGSYLLPESSRRAGSYLLIESSRRAGSYLLIESSRQAGSYLLIKSSRQAGSYLLTKSCRRAGSLLTGSSRQAGVRMRALPTCMMQNSSRAQ